MRKFIDSSENFMQGVFSLMFSQIIIKKLGLVYVQREERKKRGQEEEEQQQQQNQACIVFRELYLLEDQDV